MAVQFNIAGGETSVALQTTLGATQAVPILLICHYFPVSTSNLRRIVTFEPASGNDWMALTQDSNFLLGFRAIIRAASQGGAAKTAADNNGGSGFTVSNWFHLIGQFLAADDLQLIVDNRTPVIDATSEATPLPDILTIGARSDGLTSAIGDGDRIARVLLVNASGLSGSEITALAGGAWPPDVIPPTLILRFYDFPEGANHLKDYQGNNELTVLGDGSVTHVADPAGLSYGGSPGLGQVTETDEALPITRTIFESVGQVTETDESLALAIQKQLSLALATETDSALALYVNGSVVYLDAAHDRELRDEAETLWADVNGWEWAWYDDPNGPLNGAPIVASGTFDTDAQGEVAPFNINGTALLAGQLGALVVKHPVTENVHMWWKIPIGPEP